MTADVSQSMHHAQGPNIFDSLLTNNFMRYVPGKLTFVYFCNLAFLANVFALTCSWRPTSVVLSVASRYALPGYGDRRVRV